MNKPTTHEEEEADDDKSKTLVVLQSQDEKGSKNDEESSPWSSEALVEHNGEESAPLPPPLLLGVSLQSTASFAPGAYRATPGADPLRLVPHKRSSSIIIGGSTTSVTNSVGAAATTPVAPAPQEEQGNANTSSSTPATQAAEENNDVPPAPVPLVSAVTVEDAEATVRQQILQQAARATIVVDDEDDEENGLAQKATNGELSTESNRRRRRAPVTWGIVGVLTLVLVVVMVVVVSRPQSEGGNSPPLPEDKFLSQPTLERILERGWIRCGVYFYFPGLSLVTDASNLEGNDGAAPLTGFMPDICRAISALVFDGQTDRVEFLEVFSEDRFQKVASGEIDIIAQTVTHTMGRDVAERLSGEAFSFSRPLLYSGLAFAGIPTFVDCAEQLDSLYGPCRNLSVCVGAGTTHELVLKRLLPGPAVRVESTPVDMFQAFSNGTCNVVANQPISMVGRFQQLGYEGPFKLGTKLFAKEPLALVTRQGNKGDSEWTALVNFLVETVYSAEEANITQANVNATSHTWMLGLQTSTVSTIRTVIEAVGNYGELYEKHLGSLIPRSGVNSLNSGTTGLLYSIPFGETSTKGPSPDGKLQRVLERGTIRCGVKSNISSVADSNTTDVLRDMNFEFCRVLASALFVGNATSVEFVELDPYFDAFGALLNNQTDVDAVAGERISLSRMSEAHDRELLYSTPYVFEPETGDPIAFVTKDDKQWADFVNWVVMGTIYAEENGISFLNAGQMPVVSLFGEGLKQMLADTIIGVGNYGDVYNRSLSSTLPRSGRNLLNDNAGDPQQYGLPLV